MLATLCLLIADEGLGQRFSATIYNFIDVTNGTKALTTLDQIAAFFAEASAMLGMCANKINLDTKYESRCCQRQHIPPRFAASPSCVSYK